MFSRAGSQCGSCMFLGGLSEFSAAQSVMIHAGASALEVW